jgi:hypothetical protein
MVLTGEGGGEVLRSSQKRRPLDHGVLKKPWPFAHDRVRNLAGAVLLRGPISHWGQSGTNAEASGSQAQLGWHVGGRVAVSRALLGCGQGGVWYVLDTSGQSKPKGCEGASD